jgi:hypothetical protein
VIAIANTWRTIAHGNPSKLTLKANAQQAQFGAQCSWVRVIILMPFPKKNIKNGSHGAIWQLF